MNNIKAAQIHAALQVTLKKFAEEHGLTCVGVNTKWNSEGLRTGIIQFGEKGAHPAAPAEANVDPRFLLDLARRGFTLGLSEEMVGKQFTLNGRGGLEKFTFMGMRASKLVMKDADGKLTVWRDVIAPKIVAQFKAM